MLKGKTALITGASRGIGKAIAMKMIDSGANVAVIYSGNAEGAQTVCEYGKNAGVKAVSYQCNVADFAAVKTLSDQIALDFGSVDILVNNAGITKDNLLLRMSEEEFDGVVDVNLKGAFNFIKHFSRTIMKSPAGRIINISSVSGVMGNPGQANYSSAKAGMIGLTKTVAKELAGRNVTCNAVAPGFIETDMTACLPQAVLNNVQNVIPLKRMGRAEEVAELTVFLASEQAGYITGQVIRIDGGMCI